MIRIPKIYWTMLNSNTEHIRQLYETEQNQVSQDNARLNQTYDNIQELCQQLSQNHGWSTDRIHSEIDASWLLAYSNVPVKSTRLFPVNYYLRRQALYAMQEIAKSLPDFKTMKISASLWRIMVKRLRANIRRINNIRQYSNRLQADCKVAEKQLKHFSELVLNDDEDEDENDDNTDNAQVA